MPFYCFFFRLLLPLLFLLRISEIFLFRFQPILSQLRLVRCWTSTCGMIRPSSLFRWSVFDWWICCLLRKFFLLEGSRLFLKVTIGQNMFRKIQETLEEMSNTSENGRQDASFCLGHGTFRILTKLNEHRAYRPVYNLRISFSVFSVFNTLRLSNCNV